MTPQELLDRIAKLVALASSPIDSPQIEEARNAAYKACAMMRDHGVVVGLMEDDVLVTAQTSFAAPSKVPHRTRGERKTVITIRCSRCGRVLQKGEPCPRCVELRKPVGIWTVNCQSCGRSTPPAGSEMKVNEIAWDMGFRLDDEGNTLCPACVRARRTG